MVGADNLFQLRFYRLGYYYLNQCIIERGYMKKLLIIILLVSVIGLIGCSKGVDVQQQFAGSTEQPTEEPTVVPTITPTETPSETPIQTVPPIIDGLYFDDIQSFDLGEYEGKITHRTPKIKLGEDVFFGETATPKAAAQNAEEIWSKVYGERCQEEKPYKIYYDDKNETWLVTGSFYSYTKKYNSKGSVLGGLCYAIIDKVSGKLLAIWAQV